MPLKLVAPRAGKTPYFYVRGTYLGRYVDKSTKASDRRIGQRELQRIKKEIEEGRFAQRGEPTFLTAAVAYMDAGGEKRFVGPLLDYFKERALVTVDQQTIDEAALALYPNATPATRNRHVYTVVSAILKHAGIDRKLKRPMGAQGKQRTEWLWPEQAFTLFKAADAIDKEFGLFLRVLCYTGMRLSEALNLRWTDVRLEEKFAYVKETKTGIPRSVFLPDNIIGGLTSLHSTAKAPNVRCFRFTKSGRLYSLLALSKRKMGEASLSASFHTLRHTYATWMRRYGGLDTRGLIGTGAWKDAKSAERYAHTVVTEEAMKAALLPVEKPGS